MAGKPEAGSPREVLGQPPGRQESVFTKTKEKKFDHPRSVAEGQGWKKAAGGKEQRAGRARGDDLSWPLTVGYSGRRAGHAA